MGNGYRPDDPVSPHGFGDWDNATDVDRQNPQAEEPELGQL